MDCDEHDVPGSRGPTLQVANILGTRGYLGSIEDKVKHICPNPKVWIHQCHLQRHCSRGDVLDF